MIEIAHLAEQLKELIEHAPIPLMMLIVPGFIIGLATVATVIATLIEQQIPTEHVDHH